MGLFIALQLVETNDWAPTFSGQVWFIEEFVNIFLLFKTIHLLMLHNCFVFLQDSKFATRWVEELVQGWVPCLSPKLGRNILTG